MLPLPETPEIVTRALHNALEMGYFTTTRNETGRFLATMAGSVRGPIGECETGCGAGAAWLRLGARARTRVHTYEFDHERVERARQILDGLDIDIIEGDWDDLMGVGPFGLLSVPIRVAQAKSVEQIVRAVHRGGIIVIDDMPPSHGFPPRDINGVVDHTRLAWLSNPKVNCTEIQLASDMAAIVACRL
ncbi:O-methyltransferase [Acidipropionibacterium timonense]|uniref:SAM-dependent methyltransferase n=1 Tax=Acidipropionibacterium timonense TaxID=2161818 RepID=UPI00102F420E|nr:SAM-dependent methyltransferase [Acidipropionibacterium timonense]